NVPARRGYPEARMIATITFSPKPIIVAMFGVMPKPAKNRPTPSMYWRTNRPIGSDITGYSPLTHSVGAPTVAPGASRPSTRAARHDGTTPAPRPPRAATRTAARLCVPRRPDAHAGRGRQAPAPAPAPAPG